MRILVHSPGLPGAWETMPVPLASLVAEAAAGDTVTLRDLRASLAGVAFMLLDDYRDA